jgi:hypothetical protein
MATRRTDIASLIHQDITARELGVQNAPKETPASGETTPITHKPKKQIETIKVRLDKGDYARLQAVAGEIGSKASVMVRMAIKQMIKTRSFYK